MSSKTTGNIFHQSVFMLFKSCTISIFSYSFTEILPRAQKGLRMVWNTPKQFNIKTNNLMPFKHRNILLWIPQCTTEASNPLLSCVFFLFSHSVEGSCMRQLITASYMSFSVDTTCLEDETFNTRFKASDAQTKRLNED